MLVLKFVVRLSVVLHFMGQMFSLFVVAYITGAAVSHGVSISGYDSFLYIPLAMAFAPNEHVVYSGWVPLIKTMVVSGRLESSQRAHEY